MSTIRDKYGKSLAARSQELKKQSLHFIKITANAGRLLNRIGDLVEVDIPRRTSGNRINLYLTDCKSKAQATARIEKTLKCVFDKNGVAENVQFSRIKATVTLRNAKPKRRSRKAA